MRVQFSKSRVKKKKILKEAKGFKTARHRRFKAAKQAVFRSRVNRRKDRFILKRRERRLWILRISSFVKKRNWSYSRFMFLLLQQKIVINRKLLSYLMFSSSLVAEKLFSQVVV